MNIKHTFIIALTSSLLGFATVIAQTPAAPQSPPSTSLTEFERSLIGTWYSGGAANQPCYIASANDMVFTITQDRRAAHIMCNPEGFLLAEDYERGLRGEVSHDTILWSNGTWWSRHPIVARATRQ